MPVPQSVTPHATVLVVGGDNALREFCRSRLVRLGCAVQFARDIADAMTGGFSPDVMVADLPLDHHTAARLRHLEEFAEAIGSALVALTDDAVLLQRPLATSVVQVLPRPCAPDSLWHAVVIANAARRLGPQSGACRV
jgi:CheY-like chemotaxis protein